MTKKEIEKRMRSLENKIAYRTQRIAEMREAADKTGIKMMQNAGESAARREAAQQRIDATNERIAKTEKSWLEPLQEELAELMQKLLDE